MADKIEIFSKRTLIFISGAGQGFGRACALSAASMFTNDCMFLLCGRHIESLTETVVMIKNINQSATAEIFILDLSNVNQDDLRVTLEKKLVLGKYLFECVIVIHNAATVGDVTQFSDDFTDEIMLREYFQVNIVGTIILNSVLLRRFEEMNKDASILIVNVSSLCAVEPYQSMSLYCSGKAAREMFFRCLSLEWRSRHSQPLWVVNYGPGPMDTSMWKDLIDNIASEELKTTFNGVVASGKLLTPKYSADKLFQEVLGRYQNFESGSRLDVYDI